MPFHCENHAAFNINNEEISQFCEPKRESIRGKETGNQRKCSKLEEVRIAINEITFYPKDGVNSFSVMKE